MKDGLLISLAVVLLLACGFGAGYTTKGALDFNTVAAAKSDKDVCSSTSGAQAAALTLLQQKFSDQATQLKAEQDKARAALSARDGLQAQIDKQAQQRAAAALKVGHENKDCADLPSMAICPALAERLWPGITKGSADPPSGH